MSTHTITAAPTGPTPPPRPQNTLSPLAEAALGAVAAHYRMLGGGSIDAVDEARTRMFAAFADIGIGRDSLAALARVIQS